MKELKKIKIATTTRIARLNFFSFLCKCFFLFKYKNLLYWSISKCYV